MICAQSVSVILPNPLVNGDIVEIGVLPALTYLVDLVIATSGVGFTADIGLMDGEVGAIDSSRNCDNSYFHGISLGIGVKRINAPSAFLVNSSDRDRSIGIRVKGTSTSSSGNHHDDCDICLIMTRSVFDACYCL